jgi:tRNA(Ile)-lysidine synthase
VTTIPQRVEAKLVALAPSGRLWVAFSGGLDSHVLLHALARSAAGGAVRAIHIDHGLQFESPAWAEHCHAVCRQLGVELVTRPVEARPQPGESPEAAARRARYAAFSALLEPGDLLLTAHHQDDQAETLLLQLLRGAGPRGLAAMPEVAPLGAGRLARPLLETTRAELHAYARSEGLEWVEDPSNRELRYDRNFLRHEIMPRLRERWPAAGAVLARSAGHFAETSALLEQVAHDDAAHAQGGCSGTLSVSALLGLSLARRRNLLRHWLRRRGFGVPDTSRLQSILDNVLTARADAVPQVAWTGCEVRRYRDDLYAMAPLGPAPAAPIPWDPRRPLDLPDGLGRLEAVPATGRGVRADVLSRGPLTVRFRRGGERCRPAPGAADRTLKNLLQETGVPPWLRARMPLLYAGETLVAVADRWVCAPCGAVEHESGVEIRWQRREVIETGHENNEN